MADKNEMDANELGTPVHQHGRITFINGGHTGYNNAKTQLESAAESLTKTLEQFPTYIDEFKATLTDAEKKLMDTSAQTSISIPTDHLFLTNPQLDTSIQKKFEVFLLGNEKTKDAYEKLKAAESNFEGIAGPMRDQQVTELNRRIKEGKAVDKLDEKGEVIGQLEKAELKEATQQFITADRTAERLMDKNPKLLATHFARFHELGPKAALIENFGLEGMKKHAGKTAMRGTGVVVGLLGVYDAAAHSSRTDDNGKKEDRSWVARTGEAVASAALAAASALHGGR